MLKSCCYIVLHLEVLLQHKQRQQAVKSCVPSDAGNPEMTQHQTNLCLGPSMLRGFPIWDEVCPHSVLQSFYRTFLEVTHAASFKDRANDMLVASWPVPSGCHLQAFPLSLTDCVSVWGMCAASSTDLKAKQYILRSTVNTNHNPLNVP